VNRPHIIKIPWLRKKREEGGGNITLILAGGKRGGRETGKEDWSHENYRLWEKGERGEETKSFLKKKGEWVTQEKGGERPSGRLHLGREKRGGKETGEKLSISPLEKREFRGLNIKKRGEEKTNRRDLTKAFGRGEEKVLPP